MGHVDERVSSFALSSRTLFRCATVT